MYDYDRKTARVPGEFPENSYNRFYKGLNTALLEFTDILKGLDRSPNKKRVVEKIQQDMLEIRNRMVTVLSLPGDRIR